MFTELKFGVVLIGFASGPLSQIIVRYDHMYYGWMGTLDLVYIGKKGNWTQAL